MMTNPSLELMRTISEVLDVREVFPRVSEIANQVLPHDCLELVCRDESDHLTLHARSAGDGPEFRALAIPGPDAFHLVGDLRRTRLRLAPADPPDAVERVVAAGYRSLLNVRSDAHDQLTLAFLSKRPDACTEDDVPTARRIADYLALTVSHEQLAEAARQEAEARVRAERLTARVEALAVTRRATPR